MQNNRDVLNEQRKFVLFKRKYVSGMLTEQLLNYLKTKF